MRIVSRPAHIEETDVVAQARPDVPRLERVAILLGLGCLSAVLAVGLALYLAKFQVDHRVVNWSLAGLALAAGFTFARSRPSSALTPRERMVRENRRVFTLLGLLTGIAILGSIATAAELDTAQDWAMLAFIASSPISVGLLIHTRFNIA